MKHFKIDEDLLKEVIFIVTMSDGVAPPLKNGLLRSLNSLPEVKELSS